MRKLLFKLSLFGLITVLIPYILLDFSNSQSIISPWNAHSVLLRIPDHMPYDFVILGSSHARALTNTSQKHKQLERILDGNMINLSRDGAGIVPESLYLSYFYDVHNNSAKTMLYFLDPWALYSSSKNEEGVFYNGEPLRADFLWYLIKSGIDRTVIISYIKSKLTVTEVFGADESPAKEESFSSRSGDDKKGKIAEFYPDGTNRVTLKRYGKELGKLIELAKKHSTRVIIILPPTLLGEMPGTKEVVALLASYKKTEGIEYYDYSQKITDPKLFQGWDHLNTKGVGFFSSKFLKPVFKKTRY